MSEIRLNPQQRSMLRTQGYDDALAGRPRRSDNPEYLACYRRGVEAATKQKEAQASQS